MLRQRLSGGLPSRGPLAAGAVFRNDTSMVRGSFLAFGLVFLCVSATHAEAPRRIGWGDLLPQGTPIADPLAGLTLNQRVELRLVADARARQAKGLAGKGVYDRLTAGNLMRKLQGQGLDVDGLLAQYADFQAKLEARQQIPAAGMDAKSVLLQGYLLPLDHRKSDFAEFLLVPFVGSCIHAPIPPPNQVVVVRAASPFRTDELFAPVRVTGRMAVEKSAPVLSLVDGTAPVPSVYALKAERIELDRDEPR
jgi:hypothetical protein